MTRQNRRAANYVVVEDVGRSSVMALCKRSDLLSLHDPIRSRRRGKGCSYLSRAKPWTYHMATPRTLGLPPQQQGDLRDDQAQQPPSQPPHLRRQSSAVKRTAVEANLAGNGVGEPYLFSWKKLDSSRYSMGTSRMQTLLTRHQRSAHRQQERWTSVYCENR